MDIKTIDLNETYGLGVATPLKCFLHDTRNEMSGFNKKLPAMIVVPGGGYGFVSEREGDPIAVDFFNRHYNTFVLFYGIAPRYYHPTPVTQLAMAVDYVRRNADELNVDANKIYAVGFSAGGHLVGTLANFWHDLPVKKVGEYTLNAQPNGVVLAYPVIDNHSHEGSFKNLCNTDDVDCELAISLSLERSVSKLNPPCFIWNTVEDQIVNPSATLKYATALLDNGVNFECHVYPYGAHGLSTVDKRTCGEPDIETNAAKAWLSQADYFLKTLK